MNAPLRFNEALIIASNAFAPFECVAWTAQDKGDLSLTVIDRTSGSIGRQQISCSTYSDAAQLADVLSQARAELSEKGYALKPWTLSA